MSLAGCGGPEMPEPTKGSGQQNQPLQRSTPSPAPSLPSANPSTPSLIVPSLPGASTLRGSLVVEVSDYFDHHHSKTEFFLRLKDSNRLVKLVFPPAQNALWLGGKPLAIQFQSMRWLVTGQDVVLQGSQESVVDQGPDVVSHFRVQRLHFTSLDDIPSFARPSALRHMHDQQHLVLPENAGTPVADPGQTYPIKRKLAVILVALQDANPFLDKATAENLVFKINNDVFKKATHDFMTFPSDTDGDKKADVFGPFKINDNKASSCEKLYRTWGTMADTLAKQAKVVLTNYNHIMYIFPNLKNCRWAGKGQVGNPTGKGPYRTWVRTDGKTKPRVVAHELGHNLGLRHSSLDPDNDGKHDTKKTGEEYGDYSCFMGLQLRNLNAPHMFQLGAWSRFPKQVIAGQTGTYKLYPLLADPTKAAGPQIILVNRGTLNHLYYLSFKTKTSYDSGLQTKYITGVSIHTQTKSGVGQTRFVKALKDNEVFKDAANGLEIKQVKKDPKNAFVTIELKITSACKVSNTVKVVPERTRYIVKNKARTRIKLTMTDQADKSCGYTYFTVTGPPPGKYQISPLPYRTGLNPQVATNRYMYITNDGTSQDVTLTVNDTDNKPPMHSELKVKIRIDVDKEPPTAPSQVKGTLNKSNQVVLAWMASKDALIGLRDYQVFRTFGGKTSTVATTTKLTWTDTKPPKGVVKYTVKARDKFLLVSKASNEAKVETGPDKTPPTTPTGLVAQLSSDKLSVELTWKASTDDRSGIKHYEVYRSAPEELPASNLKPPSGGTSSSEGNGMSTGQAGSKKSAGVQHKSGNSSKAVPTKVYTTKMIATSGKVSFLDAKAPQGRLVYYVVAVDGANNKSKPSNNASVTKP